MQCEDPRNKVYGLLGLADQQERPEVDYSKPLYEVYIDAVRAITQQSWRLGAGKWPLLSFSLRNTFIDFARHVGFPQQTVRMLYSIFDDIKEAEELITKQHGHYHPLPSGVQPAVQSANTPDRWWLEVHGQRRYYDCDPKA
jgi:hypothetical protein